jgi:hypothetical protein
MSARQSVTAVRGLKYRATLGDTTLTLEASDTRAGIRDAKLDVRESRIDDGKDVGYVRHRPRDTQAEARPGTQNLPTA